MSSFTADEGSQYDDNDKNNLSSSSSIRRDGVVLGRSSAIASTGPSINVHVHPDPQSTTQHHVSVNESWRLCMEHKWMSLQMRLSMFPDEARQVQLSTKRSLLHEVVSVAAMEASALALDTSNTTLGDSASGAGTRTSQTIEREVVQVSSCSREQQSKQVNDNGRQFVHSDSEFHQVGLIPRNPIISGNKNNDQNNNSQHDIHKKDDADFVTPLMLRSVYFSCPQAMLVLDSIKGYTPLHCALVIEGSVSESACSPHHQDSNAGMSTISSSSFAFDLVRTLLDLCLGRCIVDNEDDDDDNDSFFSEDDDDEEKKEDEDDMIGNEEAVLLMRDALADTPLHTACRHGCSKYILQVLMEACPSALFHYNIARMTPLRLLWHNLEERMSIKENSIINTITNERQDEGGVARSSDSPSSDEHSRSSEMLKNILVNKIKSYKDLTNYPAIYDTWQKSVMLLHIYELSKSDHTTMDDDRGSGASHTDDVLLEDFELPESMTLDQIHSVMDQSMISTLMPQDTYSEFLKCSPSIIMKDYPRNTDANSTTENAVQKYDELKMLGITDASGQKQLQENHRMHRGTTGKRKRYFSFHDKNHHSLQNANSTLTDNKLSTGNVDYVKGIHPDENGMIPMPSYYMSSHINENAIDEEQPYKSHGTSFRLYVDEPNLFFDLDT